MKHQYQISDENACSTPLQSGLHPFEAQPEAPVIAKNDTDEIVATYDHAIAVDRTDRQQESTEQLQVLLKQEARLGRLQKFIAEGWLIMLVLIPIVVTLWHLAIHSSGETMWHQFLIILSIMILIRGVAACFAYQGSRKRRTALAAHLLRTKSIGNTTLLIDALNVSDISVRNLAQQTLIELLPTLQASDADLIGDAQRTTMVRLLSTPAHYFYRYIREIFSQSAYRREVAVRIAILKALEQVGGAKELPVVERLASGVATADEKGLNTLPEIQAAAQACLPYLVVRAQQQNVREQLLRPSSADAVSADTLLRPAKSASNEPEDQLLRASVDTGSEPSCNSEGKPETDKKLR